MPSLPVVWRIYHVANIPIHFGTLANVCPAFTLEFSDLHAQFTRCVANLPRGESSVANLPCGESSGNPCEQAGNFLVLGRLINHSKVLSIPVEYGVSTGVYRQIQFLNT